MILKISNFILPWAVNNFLKIFKLKSRDPKLWIFGAWGGDQYSDNSKYLFEYVLKHLPHINAVWITKSQKVKDQLTTDNKKCYLYHDPGARKLRLSAKYVFFTNGISDFGFYDLCHGAIKVALWHGIPLKKMAYASNNLKKRDRNPLRLIQYLFLKLYNQWQRNVTIATSGKAKDCLVECFEVKPETVLVTGQPRNDALFDRTTSDGIKRKLNHPLDKKFVLYMPTWRQFKQQDNFLNDILRKLNGDAAFQDRLAAENIILYVKPHPRITTNVQSSGHIVILENLYAVDSQELIAVADVLITDYSSVFIDFALLERPLHFFVPDLEQYQKNANGLFFSFSEFSEFWFKEYSDFKSAIINCRKFADFGLKNSEKVNSIYNDPNLEKGHYCETVIREIEKL